VRKLAFLTALLLFLYGCQAGGKPDSIEKSTRKTGLQESSDGLVLTVAGETITSDEIIMKSILFLPTRLKSFSREILQARLRQPGRSISS